MKVRLFEDLTDEVVELDIKTSAERNILVWGLTSAYGSMYKEFCIDGHTFVRSGKKDENKDGTITIKYTNDSMGTIEKFKVKYAYLEDQLKALKAAELEYDDAGEYTAEGFNKVLYTTILIDGKHYGAAMPKQPTEENFANTSMCYIVGFGCGAKIVSQAWDEGNYYVHNSRIRVNNMDFDIMYERDTERLCNSAVLAI